MTDYREILHLKSQGFSSRTNPELKILLFPVHLETSGSLNAVVTQHRKQEFNLCFYKRAGSFF